MRAFNAYIASVFLYNSEIWTLTKNLENTINTFQRRQLRNILGIHWPKTISNEELYTRTKTKPWNTTVRRRRLNWIGHMMRLHPDTPARQALTEYLRTVKHPKGRPTHTWMEQIRKDLLKVIIKLDQSCARNTTDQLSELTKDRDRWRAVVRRVVLAHSE